MSAPIETPPAMGARIKAEVDDWARFSAEEGRLTRLYLTPEHRATAEAAMR